MCPDLSRSLTSDLTAEGASTDKRGSKKDTRPDVLKKSQFKKSKKNSSGPWERALGQISIGIAES